MERLVALRPLRVCETLIQDLGSPFSLGAYVRVRGGVRRHTRDFPEANSAASLFPSPGVPG